MAKQQDFPDIGRLDLDDQDTEDLFASPSTTGANTQKHTPTSNVSSAQKQQQRARSQSETREARLKAELERVREVNKVIENVNASLTKAKENMGTVQQTVDNASTLLATWTRILSQTEHNQRLILNPRWQGATQDLEDAENEELRRQQEVERRAMEEQRRREEAQRKAEEEERRRAAAPATTGRGVNRTKSARGASASTRGYTGVGGQTGRGRGTAGSSRGSGIGRGTGTRGRARGLG
ncbi:DASH complex subunit duo1-like [Teratosphaeria destructans]|uniref:DASH complex subunit DUO1 n=1 Tax=Teratosphaeria destructans TaxID=418781 RepID=A0A9W7SJW3_9PEZI|nr:DASH complex subunit duo1-like [Teratosphaeria destructans]